MATYKEIKGRKVQTLSADPPAPTVGQVWYNSDSSLFKVGSLSPLGAWSATGAMGTARYVGQTAGTQAAAISMGGGTSPGAATGISEKYNGATWSAVNSLVGPRTWNFVGVGTSTSALAAGGNSNPPNTYLTTTETWNDTCWSTSPATISPARSGTAGAGTKTSALSWMGYDGSNLNVVQSWNDTSWATSPATLAVTAREGAGAGTKTAALSIGGKQSPGSILTNSYLWNDTSWTSTGSLGTAVHETCAGGTSSLALVMGGQPLTGTCQRFTTSTWAADASLPAATGGGMGAGDVTTAGGTIFSGGRSPAPATLTTALQWNAVVSGDTITQS
jgi:hypothetical protein